MSSSRLDYWDESVENYDPFEVEIPSKRKFSITKSAEVENTEETISDITNPIPVNLTSTSDQGVVETVSESSSKVPNGNKQLFWTHDMINTVFCSFMLFYAQDNLWERIATHLGNTHSKLAIQSNFIVYTRKNQKAFTVEQNLKLTTLVNQNESWFNIARNLLKTERQVKYQWCYLCLEAHETSKLNNRVAAMKSGAQTQLIETVPVENNESSSSDNNNTILTEHSQPLFSFSSSSEYHLSSDGLITGSQMTPHHQINNTTSVETTTTDTTTPNKAKRMLNVWSPKLVELFFEAFLLHYKDNNKWDKIIEHVGDHAANIDLKKTYAGYISHNKKDFSDEQNTQLTSQVDANIPWIDIATELKKSERQVKYQWCYLLLERHKKEHSETNTGTAPEDNRKDHWSPELIDKFFEAFLLYYKDNDKWDKITEQVGDERKKEKLKRDFRSYISSLRRSFGASENAELTSLVELETPWAEIATTMKRTERQVKYQWCHLLSLSLYKSSLKSNNNTTEGETTVESVPIKPPKPLHFWSPIMVESFIAGFLLYYQDSDKWEKIATHMGNDMGAHTVMSSFHTYAKNNKKIFTTNENITLHQLKSEDKSWSEIAIQMKKSERQVKYQWCHLLLKSHKASGRMVVEEVPAKSPQIWSSELIDKFFDAFLLYYKDEDKWDKIEQYVTDVTDGRSIFRLKAEYRNYVNYCKKVFTEEQCVELKSVVEQQTPWVEIATIFSKTERQVKYQWCNLLTREFNISQGIEEPPPVATRKLWTQEQIIGYFDAFMLYYQEPNKWSKIAAHLGDPRPNKCLSNEFYDYVKSNKKIFSEEENVTLKDLATNGTIWSEIAFTMKKSERQVRYQWCYLLLREKRAGRAKERNDEAQVSDAQQASPAKRQRSNWSPELIAGYFDAFLLYYKEEDAWDKITAHLAQFAGETRSKSILSTEFKSYLKTNRKSFTDEESTKLRELVEKQTPWSEIAHQMYSKSERQVKFQWCYLLTQTHSGMHVYADRIKMGNGWSPHVIDKFFEAFLLFYKEEDRWDRIVEYVGPEKTKSQLVDGFYGYVQHNAKLFSQDMSTTLRNMVNDNKSWPEIAGIMKKSERQVKYQWCYLLSKSHVPDTQVASNSRKRTRNGKLFGVLSSWNAEMDDSFVEGIRMYKSPNYEAIANMVGNGVNAYKCRNRYAGICRTSRQIFTDEMNATLLAMASDQQPDWVAISRTLGQPIITCKYHWCWLFVQENGTSRRKARAGREEGSAPFLWTDELDDALIAALNLHGRKNFEQAAIAVGHNVTARQCKYHVRLINTENIGNWTEQECDALSSLVGSKSSWIDIGTALKRAPKSCKYKWFQITPGHDNEMADDAIEIVPHSSSRLTSSKRRLLSTGVDDNNDTSDSGEDSQDEGEEDEEDKWAEDDDSELGRDSDSEINGDSREGEGEGMDVEKDDSGYVNRLNNGDSDSGEDDL